MVSDKQILDYACRYNLSISRAAWELRQEEERKTIMNSTAKTAWTVLFLSVLGILLVSVLMRPKTAPAVHIPASGALVTTEPAPEDGVKLIEPIRPVKVQPEPQPFDPYGRYVAPAIHPAKLEEPK